MENTMLQNTPEMMRIHEVLRKLAVTSEVSEPDRADALDIIVSEQSIKFGEFIERIREFFYAVLLNNDIDSYDIKQAVLDQYENILKMQNRSVNIGTDETPVFIPQSLMDEINTLLTQGEKIQAIKILRNHFGCGIAGLKESKDIIERYIVIRD